MQHARGLAVVLLGGERDEVAELPKVHGGILGKRPQGATCGRCIDLALVLNQRIASGVSSWIIVWRTTPLTMSAAPVMPSASTNAGRNCSSRTSPRS
jgi:hypothetical protein